MAARIKGLEEPRIFHDGSSWAAALNTVVMKIKFVLLSAIAGAMVSFALPSAQAAPVSEPTSLKALFAARKQDDKKQDEAAKKHNVSAGSATRSAKGKTIGAKASNQMAGKTTNKKTGKNGATAGKASTNKTASNSSAYSSIINRYASQYGVAPALAHAVVKHESNFRPEMRGRAGEIGLMQIKYATARGMGYSGSVKGLYDPATNIQYGMKYLAMAQKLGGGTTCGTILKYNAGHGAKRMNPTSAKYCSNVKNYMSSL